MPVYYPPHPEDVPGDAPAEPRREARPPRPRLYPEAIDTVAAMQWLSTAVTKKLNDFNANLVQFTQILNDQHRTVMYHMENLNIALRSLVLVEQRLGEVSQYVQQVNGRLAELEAQKLELEWKVTELSKEVEEWKAKAESTSS